MTSGQTLQDGGTRSLEMNGSLHTLRFFLPRSKARRSRFAIGILRSTALSKVGRRSSSPRTLDPRKASTDTWSYDIASDGLRSVAESARRQVSQEAWGCKDAESSQASSREEFWNSEEPRHPRPEGDSEPPGLLGERLKVMGRYTTKSCRGRRAFIVRQSESFVGAPRAREQPRHWWRSSRNEVVYRIRVGREGSSGSWRPRSWDRSKEFPERRRSSARRHGATVVANQQSGPVGGAGRSVSAEFLTIVRFEEAFFTTPRQRTRAEKRKERPLAFLMRPTEGIPDLDIPDIVCIVSPCRQRPGRRARVLSVQKRSSRAAPHDPGSPAGVPFRMMRRRAPLEALVREGRLSKREGESAVRASPRAASHHPGLFGSRAGQAERSTAIEDFGGYVTGSAAPTKSSPCACAGEHDRRRDFPGDPFSCASRMRRARERSWWRRGTRPPQTPSVSGGRDRRISFTRTGRHSRSSFRSPASAGFWERSSVPPQW
jgi:hypothetical protein